MGIIDTVLLLCLIPAVIVGIYKGFVRQLIAFLVIYSGISLSLRFSDTVSAWILKYVTVSEFWLKVISFVLIFVAVALVLAFMGNLLRKAVNVSMLGWLDRLLGACISVVITVALLSLLVHVVDAFNSTANFISEQTLSQSRLYPLLKDLSASVFPKLQSLF